MLSQYASSIVLIMPAAFQTRRIALKEDGMTNNNVSSSLYHRHSDSGQDIIANKGACFLIAGLSLISYVPTGVHQPS